MGESGCVMVHKREPGSPLNVALEVTNLVPPVKYNSALLVLIPRCQLHLRHTSRNGSLPTPPSDVFGKESRVDTTCLLLTRHVVLGGGDIIMLEASSVSVGPTNRLTRSTA